LAKPVSVIIGAKRLDQRQETLAAVELTLTQHELRHWDEVSALPREYPGWVLPLQGADRLEPVVIAGCVLARRESSIDPAKLLPTAPSKYSLDMMSRSAGLPANRMLALFGVG
jgi:hypothetical protein